MFSERLKQIRLKLELSVAKFADMLEMSASTLIGYERNLRTPSLPLFTQLYKKANVNLNWLVSGEGDMFNESAEPNEQLEKLVAQIVDKKMKERGL